MKQIKKINIKEVIKDRLMLVSVIGFGILCLSFFIYAIVSVQRSDLLVYNRYTGFGVLHYYRARWSYMYNWAIFGLIVGMVHGYFALTFIPNKRLLAFGCLIAGSLVILIAWFNLSHIVMLPR